MTTDWDVISLPSVTRRVARDYDAAGNEIPYNGSWHREVSEIYYLLAEFLEAKGLLADGVEVSRQADLVIRWSQLTPLGQRFIRAHKAKWLTSLDRRKPGQPLDALGLERRWAKFCSEEEVH